MEKSQKDPRTGKLDAEHHRTIIVPGSGRYGLSTSSSEIIFFAVPITTSPRQNQAPWRIILRFGAPSPRTVVGLDVYADIVLGRGSEGANAPDIDLTELDALKMGVSRRHALVRPTPNKLFLIDLDSTNGTLLNAVPVGRGMAQALRSGDAISLGGLSFTIEIVRQPWDAEEPPKEAEAAPDASIPQVKVDDGPPTIRIPRPDALQESAKTEKPEDKTTEAKRSDKAPKPSKKTNKKARS